NVKNAITILDGNTVLYICLLLKDFVIHKLHFTFVSGDNGHPIGQLVLLLLRNSSSFLKMQELFKRKRPFCVRNKVGYQAFLFSRFRIGNHYSLVYTWMPLQSGFDLSQLNPETSDLHLAIDASQVLQLSRLSVSCQIPSPIQSSPRIGIVGVV